MKYKYKTNFWCSTRRGNVDEMSFHRRSSKYEVKEYSFQLQLVTVYFRLDKDIIRDYNCKIGRWYGEW